jgi:hypothetical protein
MPGILDAFQYAVDDIVRELTDKAVRVLMRLPERACTADGTRYVVVKLVRYVGQSLVSSRVDRGGGRRRH